MAVSERWSSARVPRSVWRAAATSAMISSMVALDDSTAPVHVASPIVRKRIVFSTTVLMPLRFRKTGLRIEPCLSPQKHPAAVGKIQSGQSDLLLAEILPDVHLGPVAQGENAKVLAVFFPSVEDVPEFGPLVLRLPLTEVIPVTEESFFRARFFLVTPAAAEHGVKPVALIVSSSVTDWIAFRLAVGPCSSMAVPASMLRCTSPTTSRAPSFPTYSSR